MPRRANNSYLPAPRTRMYLVIGTALLSSIGMMYVVLRGPTRALDFLKSRSLLLVALLTLSTVLTGWLQARDPKLRPGFFFKYCGRALIIFAVGSVLLFNTRSAVPLIAFCVGLVLSVVGTMQSRAARRSAASGQSQTRPPSP